MFSKSSIHKYLNYLLYLAVFLYMIYPYSDYDWGWHYRYGEYFFQHGSLLRSDIFSWTLPGYQWINHSWGYDLIIYIIFKLGGFTGAMLVGAWIGFLVYYLSTKFFNLRLWEKTLLAIFFISLSGLFMMQSLRSQVFILVFYPILILLLMSLKKYPKNIFWLPLIFFLWANLHGTFTIGLLILALFFGANLVIGYQIERKNIILYGGTFALIIIATLFTPYGYQTYFEAIKHLSSPWLKNVFEWIPFFSFAKIDSQVFFIAYLLIFLYFFISRKKLSDIPYGLVILVLTYLTIKSNRYMGPLLGVSLPILALFLHEAKISLEKYKVLDLITAMIILIFLEISWQKTISTNLFKYSFTDYCRHSTHCSENMARFLFDNPPSGRGFNFYDWGGYLIGRGLPGKLFIDGRMHLWESQGYMPFADYINIYYQQDYRTFKKYNFDWLLLRNDSPLAQDLLKPNMLLGSWIKYFTDGEVVYYIKK